MRWRLGFTLFFLGFASLASASALSLNEICAGPAHDWDGSGTFSSRDDEWVEVVNTGATPLELGRRRHPVAGDGERHRGGGSLSLPGARGRVRSRGRTGSRRHRRLDAV